MTNIGFKVITEISRPDKDLVEQFRDLDVANIADNMGKNTCLNSSIKPYNKTKMLGTAITVKVHEGDNLMIHKAIDMAQEGDVIVVAGGGQTDRAFTGEIMLTYAKTKKIAGFLIDGAIRDVAATRESSFAVFAKGVSPKGPEKNGPGEINVPVSVGGQAILPGDIIVGDEDGVVIIRPEDAPNLVEKVKRLSENEDMILSNLKKGIAMDRTWVDEFLIEKGCTIL